VHVRAALLALLLAACGSSSASPDLGGVTTGVPCAGSQCAPCADQFCDTADYGQTGMCRAHAAPNAQSFGCDGPEDCGAQGVFGNCCMLPTIGAACSSSGCGPNGRLMCHSEADCPTGQHCCPLAAGSSYAACADSC
jgi:hypothetical protein